jgi:hypothetical protein
MTQQIKLILALNQIENLTELIKDNEYERFLYSHLISIQTELQRQLTNLNSSTKY